MLLESQNGEPPSHAALIRPNAEQVKTDELALPEQVFAGRLSAVSCTPGECSVTGVQIFAQTVFPDRRLWSISKNQAKLTMLESILSVVIAIFISLKSSMGTVGLVTLIVIAGLHVSLAYYLAYALFVRVVSDRPGRDINLALFELLVLILVWLTLVYVVLTDTSFGELSSSEVFACTLALDLRVLILVWQMSPTDLAHDRSAKSGGCQGRGPGHGEHCKVQPRRGGAFA